MSDTRVNLHPSIMFPIQLFLRLYLVECKKGVKSANIVHLFWRENVAVTRAVTAVQVWFVGYK